jgi:hypothetical protein
MRLTAGITVCYDDGLGIEDDGEETFRGVALWIARNLVNVRYRELALKVGTWGINCLCELPIFKFRDDGILELPLGCLSCSDVHHS